jgi:hypothetical protein
VLKLVAAPTPDTCACLTEKCPDPYFGVSLIDSSSFVFTKKATIFPVYTHCFGDNTLINLVET